MGEWEGDGGDVWEVEGEFLYSYSVQSHACGKLYIRTCGETSFTMVCSQMMYRIDINIHRQRNSFSFESQHN